MQKNKLLELELKFMEKEPKKTKGVPGKELERERERREKLDQRQSDENICERERERERVREACCSTASQFEARSVEVTPILSRLILIRRTRKEQLSK